MTQAEFLTLFSKVASGYKWTYTDNSLVGVARYGKTRGQLYNPVTAVARTARVGEFTNTTRGTTQAARALGLSNGVLGAILSKSNRGHAQIVRGRLLEAVSV